MPDYWIGAAVLVVAIALPFFVFTRAEHLQRINARSSSAETPATHKQAVITSANPTLPGAPSPTDQTLPSTSQPTVLPAPLATHQATAQPSARPANPAPVPARDAPPVAQLFLSTTVGPSPLSVIADASGSTDMDQTPISYVVFNFGDGSTQTVTVGMTATHLYETPGRYVLSVTVVDTANLSSTVSATIYVS